MVGVHVGVAAAVHEITGLQSAHLRYHAREQGVARDVEGHAEAHVARPLVHLARQLTVGDVKLAEHVARGQGHLLERRGVPRGEQDAPVVGVVLDLVNHLRELVHALTGVVGVHVLVLGAEVAPLEAVHRPEVALLPVTQADRVEVLAAAVAVPNVNVLVLE